jgi:glutamate-1-semialdehyde 2,1-aminomutase
LSLAATRATLEHVLTDDAFGPMIELATRYTDGVRAAFARHGLPWTVTQLGARAEYRFLPAPARTGTEAHEATDLELDDYLHVYLANRGVLLTPFHDMALMSPATTDAQVKLHLDVLGAAVDELVAG